MSTRVYRGMMASTVECADYLQQLPTAVAEGRFPRVALLRNILEGPPVNGASIRFPRRQEDFISKEEWDFIQQELPFHRGKNDHYIQVAGKDGELLSVKDWCQRLVGEVVQSTWKRSHQQIEWNVIIDAHGHFYILRISFILEIGDKEGEGNVVMILEELDTLRRADDDNTQEASDDPSRIPSAHLIEELKLASGRANLSVGPQ